MTTHISLSRVTLRKLQQATVELQVPEALKNQHFHRQTNHSISRMMVRVEIATSHPWVSGPQGNQKKNISCLTNNHTSISRIPPTRNGPPLSFRSLTRAQTQFPTKTYISIPRLTRNRNKQSLSLRSLREIKKLPSLKNTHTSIFRMATNRNEPPLRFKSPRQANKIMLSNKEIHVNLKNDLKSQQGMAEFQVP